MIAEAFDDAAHDQGRRGARAFAEDPSGPDRRRSRCRRARSRRAARRAAGRRRRWGATGVGEAAGAAAGAASGDGYRCRRPGAGRRRVGGRRGGGGRGRAGARSSPPWRRVCGSAGGGADAGALVEAGGAGAGAGAAAVGAAGSGGGRINVARSTSTPPRNTRSTCASASSDTVGSPTTTTRSARMLGASRPQSDCRPSAQAPLPVMAVTASSGVSPEGGVCGRDVEGCRPRGRAPRTRGAGVQRPHRRDAGARGRGRGRRRAWPLRPSRTLGGSAAARPGDSEATAASRRGCEASGAAAAGTLAPSGAAAVVTPAASISPQPSPARVARAVQQRLHAVRSR